MITYEGLHLHFAYPFCLQNEDHDHDTRPFKKNKKTDSGTKKQSHENSEDDDREPLQSPFSESIQRIEQDSVRLQGLLEDIVPFMVRNPSNEASSSNSSSSSHHYPPASPAFSWSSGYSSIWDDIGIDCSFP